MRLLARAAAAAFVILCGSNLDLSAQEDPSKIKSLAPGVLKVIPTVLDPRDSYSIPVELPGLTANQYKLNYGPQKSTLYQLGQNTIFFRNVWQNEFAFTGLRQAKVLMRYPDGTEKNKTIWYMVYRIRDVGKSLSYEEVKDQFQHSNFELRKDSAVSDRSLAAQEFRPHFSLEGWIRPSEDEEYQKVVYGDINSGTLADYLQSIEDPNLKLHTKDEISKVNIPLAQSENDSGVWGVAIWENVDPRVDYVSVYVSGLTNAYRINLDKDGNASFEYKTLQLNFWRAGDSFEEIKDQVEYGIPLVDSPVEQVRICRYYDLPGPIIRGYVVSDKANRDVPVASLDAEVNLVDFTSLVAAKLDEIPTQGITERDLPEEVADAFAKVGFDLGNGIKVKTDIQGKRWTFTDNGQKYILQFEPQYWKPVGKGIDFTKSLDHFWIYR